MKYIGRRAWVEGRRNNHHAYHITTPTTLVFSSTRGRFYLKQSSEQAVGTGRCRPFSPPVRTIIFIADMIRHFATVGRSPSNGTKSRSRAFLHSVFLQEKPSRVCTRWDSNARKGIDLRRHADHLPSHRDRHVTVLRRLQYLNISPRWTSTKLSSKTLSRQIDVTRCRIEAALSG